MNNAKLIGIANRIRITKPFNRGPLVSELLAAIDEDAPTSVGAVTELRNALDWDEIKSNPAAVARICRTLRNYRGVNFNESNKGLGPVSVPGASR